MTTSKFAVGEKVVRRSYYGTWGGHAYCIPEIQGEVLSIHYNRYGQVIYSIWAQDGQEWFAEERDLRKAEEEETDGHHAEG